uniref:Uncharacterized protein n=1 Tax=Siphoviridae sp. ctM4S20 TaxID=2825458 RepID=A0A8S5P988_9CAUD|nr:MAG TPA: hypothetical protein [Siphoviridae sp. ctM4S20]
MNYHYFVDHSERISDSRVCKFLKKGLSFIYL